MERGSQDSNHDPMRPEALLRGINVLDLTHYLAGPYCTMLLGDLGATVVKVERPGGGDPARMRGPMGTGENGEAIPTGFLGPNRNKLSITLNLKHDNARTVIDEMLPAFDLVVENMSAGTMSRLGLDYESLAEINPEIVLVSITGFGQPGTSPYWERPAYGQISEALSGYTSRTASADCPPVFTGLAVSDLVSGAYGAFGAVAAVVGAQRTGKGCHIDIAQYDCLVSQMERLLLYSDVQGVDVPPGDERAWLPTGVLHTCDGNVMYAAVSEEFFRRLAEVIGHPDLPDHPELQSTRDREENLSKLFGPLVQEWAQDKTREEVVEILESERIPVAPVKSIPEVLADPALDERQMYVDVDHESYGEVPYIGNPVKVDGAMRPRLDTAPALGGDTEAVLKEFAGATNNDIEAWRETGLI